MTDAPPSCEIVLFTEKSRRWVTFCIHGIYETVRQTLRVDSSYRKDETAQPPRSPDLSPFKLLSLGRGGGTLKNTVYSTPNRNESTLHRSVFDVRQTVRNHPPGPLTGRDSPSSDMSVRELIKVEDVVRNCDLRLVKQ